MLHSSLAESASATKQHAEDMHFHETSGAVVSRSTCIPLNRRKMGQVEDEITGRWGNWKVGRLEDGTTENVTKPFRSLTCTSIASFLPACDILSQRMTGRFFRLSRTASMALE